MMAEYNINPGTTSIPSFSLSPMGERVRVRGK
jgi:hypothetical protein